MGIFFFFFKRIRKRMKSETNQFQRETIRLNRNWTTVSISVVSTGTKDLVEMRLFSTSQLPFLVSKWVEQFCKLFLNGSSSVQRRCKTGWKDIAFNFFKSSAAKVGWHRRNQIAQLTFQDQNRKPKGKKNPSQLPQ